MNHQEFPGAANVPIVGQPFTITGIETFPVTMTLDCNCGQFPQHVKVVMSQPATCPACKKQYFARFNPGTAKLEVQISLPKTEEPS